MSARFQDQVIIVTGAVGGIGSAIVEGFLAEGGMVGTEGRAARVSQLPTRGERRDCELLAL